MPQNFLACDREQELLLPPSLREWLAEDHFAWFVIDVVGELDLAAFFAAYRADGHGRAAHDPASGCRADARRRGRGGWHQGACQRVRARDARLRADRARDP